MIRLYLITVLVFYFEMTSSAQGLEKNDWVTKKLKNSDYYLTIPRGIRIKDTEGVDFTVYNLTTKGTKDKNYAGIYFGHYPDQLVEQTDSCELEFVKGKVLDRQIHWRINNCDSVNLMETIINKENGLKIHAFAYFDKVDARNKFIKIFESLEEK